MNGTCSICSHSEPIKNYKLAPDVRCGIHTLSPCSWSGFTLLSLPCFGHAPDYCSAKAQTAGQIKGTSADKPCLSCCISHTYLSFTSANIVNYEFRTLARILLLLLLQKVKCFADIVYRPKPWKFISRARKNFEENVHSNPTLQCLLSKHNRNTIHVHWIKAPAW